ncbi:MAG: pilus assembly protein [Desulfuromonadales bacterium]
MNSDAVEQPMTEDETMLEKVDKNKVRHSERGVAVVEFAILASLFLVIVFGLLEFSIIFLQNHYIAGAVREGVRTGVVANNYECYKDCDNARWDAVDTRVRDYVSKLFDSGDIEYITIERDPPPGETGESVELKVEVKVRNFMPVTLTGLIPGYKPPETFRQSATGAYEDPSEP